MPRRPKITDNPDSNKQMNLPMGTLVRKKITKQTYQNAVAQHNVGRNQNGGRYGAQVISNHANGNIKQIRRSAWLRRRNPGAQRQALSAIAVINPGYNPNPANKAHGIPDVFGGPNDTQNLTNETRDINLKAHKRIENGMNLFMQQADNGAGGAHKRRGSMVLDEELDNTGKATQRDYFVHTDAGVKNGVPVPERFDHYRFKRK